MPVATYEIQEQRQTGYEARGGAAQLWRYKGAECVLSGPAETGKTRAALEKLDALMWKYAGAQAAIVRKTRTSMTGSVLQTYERKVLGAGSPVRIYGGNSAEWYDYPNGSRVYVGGIDIPGKVLSSERDVIYVNQTEELDLSDWETLTTRATGRAGNMPYAQVMGDCNPGSNLHWIKGREAAGRLKLFESRHEDNPTLYDSATGQLTDQGRRTMDVLDSLSGVRYKRLRLGLWVAAEGQVYDGWDPAIHLIDRFDIPPEWRRIRSIDFGYKNPFVCQWWALDPDGRMYMYRELYITGRLVEDLAADIVSLSAGESIEATYADHDAEDRATAERHGVITQPANKSISPGIQRVQTRLRKAGDGKARLFVFRDALVERDAELHNLRKPCSTPEEMEVYVWEPDASGKPNKEKPRDKDNHGADATRYAVMGVDEGSAGVYF